MTRIETADEIAAKKVFRWAIDWPGWARGGRTSDLALEALIVHAPRYAIVADAAGVEFPSPSSISPADLPLVGSIAGGAGTDFGVPSGMTEHDRRPTDAVEAQRLARLVEAAWLALDRCAAAAPAELRKGPRGGGRDTARIVDHVIDADQAYAHEMGLRRSTPTAHDRRVVEAERAAMVDLLGRPSDGSPLAGRRWTVRYAARRIAWHALDHAWEIEDRSGPV
jgi:hypothetical protein